MSTIRSAYIGLLATFATVTIAAAPAFARQQPKPNILSASRASSGKGRVMSKSWKWIAWTLALSFACSVTSAAWAQTRKAQAASVKFTPEQTKTLDGWSHAVALNAATWGGPLVIMYSLRYNDAVGPKAKAAPNSLWRMENITTPSIAEEEGYVLPNDSVLYGFGFLDLRQEPVILLIPAAATTWWKLWTCTPMPSRTRLA
jgi:hypothetical protein